MDDAFKFIIKNGGLTTESSYPYTAADGKCKSGSNSAATIKGYEDVPANDEAALMKAVANQPVSVAMALDIPTGVDATSGAGKLAVNADLTISFGTVKRGHLLARGECGAIVVVDIGLEVLKERLKDAHVGPASVPLLRQRDVS